MLRRETTNDAACIEIHVLCMPVTISGSDDCMQRDARQWREISDTRAYNKVAAFLERCLFHEISCICLLADFIQVVDRRFFNRCTAMEREIIEIAWLSCNSEEILSLLALPDEM